MKDGKRQYLGKRFAPRYARLWRAVQRASTKKRRASSLSCAECEQALEFYVDAQDMGEDARALYPTLDEHLKRCPRCRRSYGLLTAAED